MELVQNLKIGGLALALTAAVGLLLWMLPGAATPSSEARIPDPAPAPVRTDHSPSGRIEIGTALYQKSGELAGSVLDVSNRDPATGEKRKMVKIQTPAGAEWKTRETVIKFYHVEP
jgi:hypothetical protein